MSLPSERKEKPLHLCPTTTKIHSQSTSLVFALAGKLKLLKFVNIFWTLNFRGAAGSWIIDAPKSEALTAGGPAVWVATSGHAIPEGAFIGGEDNGEGLIVGRALHEGALIPGGFRRLNRVKYIVLTFELFFRKGCRFSWSLLRRMGRWRTRQDRIWSFSWISFVGSWNWI